MPSQTFQIEFAAAAFDDLKAIRAFDRKKIVEGIRTHLTYEPSKTSRSRIKQMGQPFWSQYRLRIDDFRVYYDVAEEKSAVTIIRILEKGTDETPQEQSHEAN